MHLPLPERQSYYADVNVRTRLGEFFGGALPEQATAVYFAAGTDDASRHRDAMPIEDLPSCLNLGKEINRSLWDRRSLLAHLDVEYVNFDAPGRAYVEPETVFHRQQPVAAAVEEILRQYGIVPLHLLTGRGHHFVWRVEQGSAAFARLAGLGHVSASLQLLYATERSPTGETVSLPLGRAFAGLGLVMEYLAHRVKELASPHSDLPVEFAAIETGGGAHDREVIALDITEYADPLCSRVVRAPFSIYLKASQQRGRLEPGLADRLPPIFIVPLVDGDWRHALEVAHDPRAVLELAATTSAEIPNAGYGMDQLTAAYEASPLAKFHADYYAQQHDAPSSWPETYDCTPLEVLPPCARRMLEQPNDLLLRPACAQRVIRVMLALGWHPRHIAGLIRSKYERDHAWGDQWRGCDPATRADFYARVFTGLIVTGADDLLDFNCQSAREEGLCFNEYCTENLEPFRDSLLERRTHERLACRPFNRLFLPAEHL